MSMQRLANVTKDQSNMRALQFYLTRATKDWFYEHCDSNITNLINLKIVFLDRYFLASKTASIQKEICEIKQKHNESFSEY